MFNVLSIDLDIFKTDIDCLFRTVLIAEIIA